MGENELSVSGESVLATISDAAERLRRRASILALQEDLAKLPQLDLPLKHYFSKGLYVREIFMPKGAVVIGKIHKTEHPNIISRGKVLVASESDVRKVEAPYTYISGPGTKKVLLILEDTVWTTCHVTEETDLEKLEVELIAPDYDDPALLEMLDALALEAAKEVEA